MKIEHTCTPEGWIFPKDGDPERDTPIHFVAELCCGQTIMSGHVGTDGEFYIWMPDGSTMRVGRKVICWMPGAALPGEGE